MKKYIDNIIDLLDNAIKNNGIVKIEHDNYSNLKTYQEKKDFLIFIFDHVFENSDFLISAITYPITEAITAKQKKTINNLITKIDNQYVYINVFQIFNIKDENVENFKPFINFFDIIKDKCKKHYINYKIQLLLEKKPLRLEVCATLQKKEDIPAGASLSKFIIENELIKNWTRNIAVNLSKIGPYSWINMNYKMVLNQEEKTECYQDFYKKQTI